jgi:hypothetical protein
MRNHLDNFGQPCIVFECHQVEVCDFPVSDRCLNS